jgi:hypothetical protein
MGWLKLNAEGEVQMNTIIAPNAIIVDDNHVPSEQLNSNWIALSGYFREAVQVGST